MLAVALYGMAGFAPAQTVFHDGFEAPAAPARWVSGYYVGYERGLQAPDQLALDGITHLMVGRVRPLADASVTTDFDIDHINGPLWAQQAVDAAHAAQRKAILMVGGAGEIDGWRGAAAPVRRAAFVANLLATMDRFGADGLDLDWEPIDPEDYTPLLAVAQALRTQRPGIVLSIPLGWVNTNFLPDAGFSAFVAALVPHFDQINLMTYEMANAYDGWHSWFASPLRGHAGNTPSSVESSVQYYRAAGVPAAKLGVGIGFYGACFRGVTTPRVPVTLANFIASDGAMSYRNIRNDYLPLMTYHYDTTASAPWLSSATQRGAQRCNYVTYEDPASITAKGAFVRDAGLGGVIIWTISQGHVPGLLPSADPLLDAVRDSVVR